MKAIHGGKTKNDKVDSHKIASLIRGGTFPVTFVYPRDMRYKSNRKLVDSRFSDPNVQKNVDLDIRLINFYDEQLSGVEWYIKKHAKINDYQSHMLLNSVPGIGKIISLVILYLIRTFF
ncbi:MAG: hypothetical protein GXP56_02550 [Deltaproteobacteria bacterium]|nr:hypothetical protein [Deltaproteobacteria bacterium]